MSKMCSRFPGSIMFRIPNPFDKVFGAVMTCAMVEDSFDFIFWCIINGDWRWRRIWKVAVRERGWFLVWSE